MDGAGAPPNTGPGEIAIRDSWAVSRHLPSVPPVNPLAPSGLYLPERPSPQRSCGDWSDWIERE